MANTFAYGRKSVGLSAIDSDYSIGDTLGANVVPVINFILFKPGAVNDVIDIRDGEGGPPLLCGTSVDGGPMFIAPCTECSPFLDYSACTLTTGAEVSIYWE